MYIAAAPLVLTESSLMPISSTRAANSPCLTLLESDPTRDGKLPATQCRGHPQQRDGYAEKTRHEKKQDSTKVPVCGGDHNLWKIVVIIAVESALLATAFAPHHRL